MTSVIRTGLPIIVELIDLANSVIFFLSQTVIFSLCSCLSFHCLSIIFTTRCPVSSHCLWLFPCWLGRSSWSFGRCSMEGYLKTQCFCCCSWILWVDSGWNWCIYPSSKVSGEASPISMVFSCLCCCQLRFRIEIAFRFIKWINFLNLK